MVIQLTGGVPEKVAFGNWKKNRRKNWRPIRKKLERDNTCSGRRLLEGGVFHFLKKASKGKRLGGSRGSIATFKAGFDDLKNGKVEGGTDQGHCNGLYFMFYSTFVWFQGVGVCQEIITEVLKSNSC